MKRNLIFTFFLAAFTFIQALAQTTSSADRASRREKMAASTPEQRAQRQTAQMKKQLSLSADQETSVASINLKYAKQAQTLMDGDSRDRGTMKQARTMMAGKDGELKKVLSDDQYKKYDELKDARKDRAKQKRAQQTEKR